MPTYQYRCTSCAADVEVVQKFTDDPLTDCPECQGRLRKEYGSIGVTFNGSGFYRTDSRSGSGKSSTAPASSKSESSASAKPSSMRCLQRLRRRW